MSQIEVGSYAGEKFESGWKPGSFSHESNSAETTAEKPRILVVDDEERVANTLRDILMASGFEACAVHDGWSALETVRSFHPDYLLTDVLMPRMNGVQLAIAARNIRPGIKVLLFSGQVGISAILEEGQKQGFSFPLIGKPAHPLKLIERLKAL